MEVETPLDNSIPRGGSGVKPDVNNDEETGSRRGSRTSGGNGRDRIQLDAGFVSELEAYQRLSIDYNDDDAAFMTRDLRREAREVRQSNPEAAAEAEGDLENGNSAASCRSRRSSSIASNRRMEFNFDGTVNCSDINYDLLCRVAGRPSLDRLTSLTISVAFPNSSDNLSMLSYCTPGLTTLRLDNSRIQSLRVLGEELFRLKTLSVCYCGIEDLDGVNYAPNLTTLVAAFNNISDVYPITELRKIHTLDLEDNDFDEYSSISFLFICPKLENLVLKGNPISFDSEYRPTIFRMLPGLKNLDEIMYPRAQRFVCNKKDPSPFDDNIDGAGAPVINDIPKELEDVIEPDGEKKPVEEKKDPLEDELIKDLMNQKSDDEKDNSAEETTPRPDEDADGIPEDIEVIEPSEVEEEVVEEASTPDEESSISMSMTVSLSKEDNDKSESISERAPVVKAIIEEKGDTKPSDLEKEEEKDIVEHRPIIMDRRASVVPTTSQSSSRLLNRRKSLDPVRLRGVKHQLFGGEDSFKSPTKEEPKIDPAGTGDSPGGGGMASAPNLKKLMSSTAMTDKTRTRPDSGLSFSSTATTTCSLSEADSGVGDVSLTSRSAASTASPSTIKPFRASGEVLPRLEERKGKGGASVSQMETPSKRTKRADKAKLLRTNSDLSGVLTTEGDVEMEDFD